MGCIDFGGDEAAGLEKEIGAEKGAAIGRGALDEILSSSCGLERLVADNFEPHEGVYRINDRGDYVSEEDFDRFWSGRPSWHLKAWMLADNGQYSGGEVASMSVREIERAFDDPSFEPEIAFYTEADEFGLV